MPPSKQPCGHGWVYYHAYDRNEHGEMTRDEGWCCKCEIERLKKQIEELEAAIEARDQSGWYR